MLSNANFGSYKRLLPAPRTRPHHDERQQQLSFWGLLAFKLSRGWILVVLLLLLSTALLLWFLEGFSSCQVSVAGGVVVYHPPPPPGTTYKALQVFENLWPFMQLDESYSSNALRKPIWHREADKCWVPCISRNLPQTELPRSNGFLIIEGNGGLNQQRSTICDAVAVAGLLNATLVTPMIRYNSDWQDSSKFGDIFDEEFFVSTLRNHVNVIKEIPEDILHQFDNSITNIKFTMIEAWSDPNYYLRNVLPKLLQRGVIRIAPSSKGLVHSVPSSIEGLRCLTNYEALRFSEPIRALAESMIDRMVKNSSISDGKYVSVHLQFEKDNSGCTYDGSADEKHHMDRAGEKGLRKYWKSRRIIDPDAIWMNGKCPLTPLEVGMMLRGMGFNSNTPVYVATGKIDKVEKYLAHLRLMFPRLETKETLASRNELFSFKGHSSSLAALDYRVCLYSEVFVTTQGENFPHFLIGHRRYLYGGHAKTIKPNETKLALLFDSPNIRWEDFKSEMQEMLVYSDLKGREVKRPSSSVYSFPVPDCMCDIGQNGER